MKISIITVCKDAATTIRDTLESVANQSWPDIEHIIIDGLSNDNTLEIAGSYPHISAVVSERDAGLYDAMNKGIERATGEIVGILNADDFYSGRDVIEKVAGIFKAVNCDALYGNLVYVDRNEINKVKRTWRSGDYQLHNLYNGWSLPHPTFFVKRSLYVQYGLYDTRFMISADYELTLRFLLKYQVSVKYLDETLVVMRTGGTSNRNLKSRFQANREDRQAWVVNGLKPHLFTLILKPLTKLKQFNFTWQK